MDTYKPDWYLAVKCVLDQVRMQNCWRHWQSFAAVTICIMRVCLQEDDVILSENSIDFAMKNQNPLDNVHFFDNFDSQRKYSMRKNTVSPMFPDIFQASSFSHHVEAQVYLPASFVCQLL